MLGTRRNITELVGRCEGTVVEDEVRVGGRGQISLGFMGHDQKFVFYSVYVWEPLESCKKKNDLPLRVESGAY
jgi:hypothetical protein